MMRITIFFLVLTSCFAACQDSYRAASHLSTEQAEEILLKIAPYVNKKYKKADTSERFLPEYRPFYAMLLKDTEAELRYYHTKEDKQYFFYNAKDITSLYEHYRAQGGFFKMDENDSIVYMEVFFYTPRLTREEMDKRGKELFEEMVTKGTVERFVGNMDYIKVPNADFYYETTTNTWEYTENSSWNFLKEAREEAKEEAREEVK